MASSAEEGGRGEVLCSLCQEELGWSPAARPSATLECGHRFHRRCLREAVRARGRAGIGPSTSSFENPMLSCLECGRAASGRAVADLMTERRALLLDFSFCPSANPGSAYRVTITEEDPAAADNQNRQRPGGNVLVDQYFWSSDLVRLDDDDRPLIKRQFSPTPFDSRTDRQQPPPAAASQPPTPPPTSTAAAATAVAEAVVSQLQQLLLLQQQQQQQHHRQHRSHPHQQRAGGRRRTDIRRPPEGQSSRDRRQTSASDGALYDSRRLRRRFRRRRWRNDSSSSNNSSIRGNEWLARTPSPTPSMLESLVSSSEGDEEAWQRL